MTWLRQAAHIAAKDGRMAWALLATLVLLTLLWAFQVGAALGGLWALLLSLVGLVGIAYVVQADPALRSDAYWVALPLSPGAVFGAKLLCATAVLLLALLGEGILLARHDAPAADVVHQLLETAASQGWLLCVALLLAALTRDLRSYLLALVLGFVAVFLLATGLAVGLIGRHRVGPPPWLWPVLLVAGSLAIAAYHYRSGRRLRAAVAGVVFLGVVLVLSAAYQPNPFDGPSFGSPLPQRLRPDSVIAARLVTAPGQAPDAGVSVHLVGGSRQLEYTLSAASLEARQPDGSVTNLPLFPPTRVSAPGAVPPVPGARWVNVYTGTARYSWTGLPGPSDQSRLSLTPLRLDGEIQALEPSVDARLPLRPGEMLAKDGRRIHIVAAGIRNGDVGIDLEVSRIAHTDEPYMTGDRLAYGLLDRTEGTIYPLTRGSSSGGSASVFVGGDARVTREHLQLASGPTGKPALPAGPGPFELLVIDWRIVGSYHVNLPVQIRIREMPAPPVVTIVRSGSLVLPLPAH